MIEGIGRSPSSCFFGCLSLHSRKPCSSGLPRLHVLSFLGSNNRSLFAIRFPKLPTTFPTIEDVIDNVFTMPELCSGEGPDQLMLYLGQGCEVAEYCVHHTWVNYRLYSVDMITCRVFSPNKMKFLFSGNRASSITFNLISEAIDRFGSRFNGICQGRLTIVAASGSCFLFSSAFTFCLDKASAT